MQQVDFGGQIHQFPDDFTEAEIARALQSTDTSDAELKTETEKVKAQLGEGPQVPTYGSDDKLITPEDRARANIIERRQKAQFEASRTPARRFEDTGSFITSLPIRMATKGEYGLGDVASAAKGILPGVDEKAVADVRRGEAQFAQANPGLIDTMQMVGDVGAGIPALGTMGAAGSSLAGLRVAAQMGPRATVARALSNTAESVGDFLRDETGAAKVPGGPAGPVGPAAAAAGAPPPPAPPPPPNSAGALPGAPAPEPIPSRGMLLPRNELIAAGQRVAEMIPEERFAVSRAAAGSATQQQIAGALKAIPYVGDPLTQGYNRELGGLGKAMEKVTSDLGAPGSVGAGTNVKIRVADWMKNPTAMDDTLVSDMYKALDKQVKSVPVNLGRTRAVVNEFKAAKKSSTTGAYDSAVGILKDMIDLKKFPQGMPFKDILEKRKEVGALMNDKLVKDIDQQALSRAYKALTEDLKFAIKRGGGRKGLDMFEEANTAAQNASEIRKAFEKLVGPNGEKTPEQVTAQVREMAKPKGDISTLRLLKRVMPEDEFNSLGATFVEGLGRNPKNLDFSPGRMLTEMSKYAPSAQRIIFGKSYNAIKDIQQVSEAYDRYAQNFNYSRSGTVVAVNGMLKALLNPTATATTLAAGFVNPLAWVHTAGAATGFQAGRSAAWALAKPAVMDEAVKVLKTAMRAQRRATSAARAPGQEAALDTAIKSYSQAAAKEGAGDPSDIEARVRDAINQNSLFRGETQ